ncbi:hypothetical protein BC943DRAFT_316166 [Umbelopsis sp. AD052]|nr:hypothetical protein BC943DRAFT_316166 [Umbelopsis sp. AD052]
MRLIETSGSNNVGADGMVNTYEALPSVNQLSSFGSDPPTPMTTTPVIALPEPIAEKVNLKLPPFESDEKAADEDEKKNEQVVKAIFTFAKNVRNVPSVLSPSHLFQQTSNEYLHQIAKRTDTTCNLEDRTITITGNNEKDVKAAEQCFQVLQAIYKRSKKYSNKCKPIAVTHYPTKFDHFGLAFCHLPRYAYLNIIDLPSSESRPIQAFFVLIPAFKDNQGKYMPPKLMVEDQTIESTNVSDASSSSPRSFSLIDADKLEVASPSIDTSSIPKSPPATNPSKIPQFHVLTSSNGATKPKETIAKEAPTVVKQAKMVLSQTPPKPDVPVLTSNSKSKVLTIQSSTWPQTAVQTRQPWSEISEPADLSIGEDSFPPLDKSSKASPTKTVASSGRKQDDVSQMNRQFRVMRLTQLPADTLTPESDLSPVEALRAYNFHTIYATLHEAFEDVRGYKGDLRFSASLGKVLWSNIKPEVQQKIWEYTDLRDIVQNQYGAVSQFNNITTTQEEIINSISDILPQPFGRSAHYEITANARNQPQHQYSEVNMKVNANYIDLEKVTVCHQTLAEIDWVSLDRKFDFSLKLTKKDQLRTDIKPFTTFIRKVSMSVKSRNITFQNIPDFLDVKQILFKQTQRFRLHYPFIVEITRVELLPLQRQGPASTILGHTGKGPVWFEFEVLFNEHFEHFKENLKLPIGTLASWTADDMLGPEDTGAKFVEIIKCMLLFVEQSHRVC